MKSVSKMAEIIDILLPNICHQSRKQFPNLVVNFELLKFYFYVALSKMYLISSLTSFLFIICTSE